LRRGRGGYGYGRKHCGPRGPAGAGTVRVQPNPGSSGDGRWDDGQRAVSSFPPQSISILLERLGVPAEIIGTELYLVFDLLVVHHFTSKPKDAVSFLVNWELEKNAVFFSAFYLPFPFSVP
jgi:hypothetical protein